MDSHILLIETSGRVGQVGLAIGSRVLASRRLDEARRHARDLAPSVGELLKEIGWKPNNVQTVIVSRGPGSYTGLRVGIMSAKTFAFATGCQLIAVDTFAAIARNSPLQCTSVEIIADAQQGKMYAQGFARTEGTSDWQPDSELRIQTLADWQLSLRSKVALSGPGLEIYRSQLSSNVQLLDPGCWHPRLNNLLLAGLARLARNERDDVWSIEPLYLRASAAEEKWIQKGV